MRKATFLGILALLLVLCAAPVYADGIPAFPHAFYGTVSINGIAAPVNTQVSATGTGVITGIEDNPTITTTAGVYGSTDPFAHKLLVQGDIQDGTIITFYVNGVSTGLTAEWHSGTITQLNLSVTIVEPTPPPGGGGGGLPTVTTNIFGSAGSININSAGVIQETFTATSADGKLTITILKGTTALDRYGNPLSTLTASINPDPPPPPENTNVIGLAYNFGPAGATFEPPIVFSWNYDPATLPAGIAGEDLVIAYYDTATAKWVELECVIDTINNKISAFVSHFTIFAIIGKYAPAAFALSSLVVSPVEVAPDEIVTVSVSISNTGGLQGTYTVVLNINGVKEAESNVTIAPGGTQTVNFSVAKAEAGIYEVTVDGLSGSFTVIAPETTTPPPTTPTPTTPTPTTPAPTTPTPTTPAPTTPTPTTPTPTTPAPTTPAPTTPAPTAPQTTVPVISPPTPSNNWPLIGGIVGGILVVVLLIFLFARRSRD